jgi:hypothetical protein
MLGARQIKGGDSLRGKVAMIHGRGDIDQEFT